MSKEEATGKVEEAEAEVAARKEKVCIYFSSYGRRNN